MRVQDFSNLNKTSLKKLDIFKEGSFVSGKILKLDGETVLIDIDGIGTIEAKTKSELKNYVDKKISFMVKSKEVNEIELKPVIDRSIDDNNPIDLNNNKSYLKEILRRFDIKDNEISLRFLDNLIKYRVEINKENLYKGISILDKLEEFINIKEEKIPLYINMPSNNQEKIPNIKNINIQNIIFTDQTQTTIKNENSIKVNDLLNRDIKIDENLIKTVAFFTKYKIEPSINNINFFIELKEKPESFSKDYEILVNIIDKEFTNIDKNIMISNGKEKNLIVESYREYIQNLEKIINLIKKNSDHKDNSIENLANRMKFLKELNNELVFVYLPLKLKEDIHDGIITFLKKRRKKPTTNNDINIFINLNTSNLGKIKIICRISGFNMEIKFENIKDKDLNLFKKSEGHLKALVNNTGYELINIVYSGEESENILDALIVDSKPIYFFDVKV